MFRYFSALDVSTFYSRARNRQMCRVNEGIAPIEQGHSSDESSDDESPTENAELTSPETGNSY